VVYLTVKGAYGADTFPGWRLVAVLNVEKRFETHDLAAAWYCSKSLALPSNCIVEGNPPKPLELTNGHPPAEIRARFPIASEPERAIRLWDAGYRQRVAKWPVFLICNTVLLDLHAPPQIVESDLLAVFGRIPGTLTPPLITRGRLDDLIQAARHR